eukprot:231985-Chlamydomonas_euryale.AAC.1
MDLLTCFNAASNLDRAAATFSHEDLKPKPDDDEASPIETPGETTRKEEPDYEKLQPFFLHVPVEKIKRTFQATTQYASERSIGHQLFKTYKSPNPVLNLPRRHEAVATDTIYGACPAIDGGATYAQLFVGRSSGVIDIYGMCNSKEFVNTLEDVIRKRGAMDKLISDNAQEETSRRVVDILRSLMIKSWQSEAHFQHQNYAERVWQRIKRYTNWYMNYRDVQPNCWLLCMQWVADVMNHTAEKSLGWRTPLEVLTGQTPDISILLSFLFWDVVYITRDGVTNLVGSADTNEVRGRFV